MNQSNEPKRVAGGSPTCRRGLTCGLRTAILALCAFQNKKASAHSFPCEMSPLFGGPHLFGGERTHPSPLWRQSAHVKGRDRRAASSLQIFSLSASLVTGWRGFADRAPLGRGGRGASRPPARPRSKATRPRKKGRPRRVRLGGSAAGATRRPSSQRGPRLKGRAGGRPAVRP